MNIPSLSLLLLLQFFLLLLPLLSEFPVIITAKQQQQTTIAIIGSGVASHAAVHKLLSSTNNNNNNVKIIVLEAMPRTGGRTFTYSIGTAKVDAGAQWLHGVSIHPWMDAVKKNKIKYVMDHAEENNPPGSLVIINKDGQQLPSSQALKWDADFYKVLNQLDQDSGNYDRPLSDGMGPAYNRAKKSGKLKKSSDLYNIVNDPGKTIYGFMKRYNFEEDYAGGEKELSLWWWDDDSTLPGGDALVPMGTGNLLNTLFPFPLNVVDLHLNSEVIKIDSSSTSSDKVKIYIKNTQNPNTITNIVVDAVICTVPLGVLQARTITWIPNLPESTWKKLSHRKPGATEKVILRFATRWWQQQQQQSSSNNVDAGEIWELHYIDPDADFLLIYDVTHLNDDKIPILVGFITGSDHVARFSGKSDQTLIDAMMQQLAKMFPQIKQIPNPISSQTARWVSMPYFRGSWSFNGVGVNPSTDFNLIANTWRIQFAGEHTSRTHFGTINGAWSSGLDAMGVLMGKLGLV
jgi:polyamine oxidase